MNARCLLLPLSLSLVSPIFADDEFPGVFRGDPNTVEAHWTSVTNQAGAGASQLADSLFHIGPYPLYAGEPFFSEGGAFTKFPTTGILDIHMPNVVDLLPFKEIIVQLYWEPDALSLKPAFGGGDYTEGPSTVSFDSSAGTEIDSGIATSGDEYAVWRIDLTPNPDWERLRFAVTGLTMTQIDVDTLSIPEPGTYALLSGLFAVGWLALRRRAS